MRDGTQAKYVIEATALPRDEKSNVGVEITFDEDILRAALDFVDEFATSQRPKATATRRRLELIDLREQSVELHRRLAQLRQKRSNQAEEWELLVSCQRQRRKRAEDENASLRAMLKKYSRTTRQLRSLLGDRCWMETASVFADFLRCDNIKAPRPLSRIDRERLLQEAFGMYGQVSTIFDQQHTASATIEDTKQRGVIKHLKTELGEAVEFFDLRPTPLDFSKIGEAVWQHAINPKIPGEYASTQDIFSSDARVERQFQFHFRLPESDQHCDAECHAVILRYRLPNAVVVLWVNKMETHVASERSVLTVSTTEKMWVLVQPLETGVSAPISVARCYGTLMPSVRSAFSQKYDNLWLATYRWRTDHGKDHWGEIESSVLLSMC